MFKSNNGLLSKFYNLNPVELPSQSFGSCFNNRKCGNINVDLADGFCVKCWDVGKNKNEGCWGGYITVSRIIVYFQLLF